MPHELHLKKKNMTAISTIEKKSNLKFYSGLISATLAHTRIHKHSIKYVNFIFTLNIPRDNDCYHTMGMVLLTEKERVRGKTKREK